MKSIEIKVRYFFDDEKINMEEEDYYVLKSKLKDFYSNIFPHDILNGYNHFENDNYKNIYIPTLSINVIDPHSPDTLKLSDEKNYIFLNDRSFYIPIIKSLTKTNYKSTDIVVDFIEPFLSQHICKLVIPYKDAKTRNFDYEIAIQKCHDINHTLAHAWNEAESRWYDESNINCLLDDNIIVDSKYSPNQTLEDALKNGLISKSLYNSILKCEYYRGSYKCNIEPYFKIHWVRDAVTIQGLSELKNFGAKRYNELLYLFEETNLKTKLHKEHWYKIRKSIGR